MAIPVPENKFIGTDTIETLSNLCAVSMALRHMNLIDGVDEETALGLYLIQMHIQDSLEYEMQRLAYNAGK